MTVVGADTHQTLSGVATSDASLLEELGRLHEQGILTDDEFSQAKAKLLAG